MPPVGGSDGGLAVIPGGEVFGVEVGVVRELEHLGDDDGQKGVRGDGNAEVVSRKETETTGRRPKNRAPRGQFLLAHAPFYKAAGQDEIAPFAGHCFPLDFSTKMPAAQDAAGSFKVFTGVPLRTCAENAEGG